MNSKTLLIFLVLGLTLSVSTMLCIRIDNSFKQFFLSDISELSSAIRQWKIESNQDGRDLGDKLNTKDFILLLENGGYLSKVNHIWLSKVSLFQLGNNKTDYIGVVKMSVLCLIKSDGELVSLNSDGNEFSDIIRTDDAIDPQGKGDTLKQRNAERVSARQEHR